MAALLGILVPACGSGSCGGDGPGAVNGLASAERWVRVVSMGESPGGEGTSPLNLEVVAVDPSHGEGVERTEAIAVHPSFLSGIEDGLAEDDDVFLALASKGLEREQVAYVIVRGRDGAHGFVGECAEEQEAFLREQLGDRYDATMGSLIGVSGSQRIKALLSRAGLRPDR